MTIHEFIEENRAAMVSDIIDLVNIPTVYSEDADSGQPFGKEVDRGLKWILDRAEVMGMETKDFDGYAGEITAGDGPFMIGGSGSTKTWYQLARAGRQTLLTRW